MARIVLLIAILYMGVRVMALQNCQVYENPQNAKLILSSVKISEEKNNQGMISVIGRATQNQKKPTEKILTYQGKMKSGHELFAFASADLGADSPDRATMLLRQQKGTLTINKEIYKVRCQSSEKK